MIPPASHKLRGREGGGRAGGRESKIRERGRKGEREGGRKRGKEGERKKG